MKTLSLLIRLRMREMFSALFRTSGQRGKKRAHVLSVLLALLLVYAAGVFMVLFFGLFAAVWVALTAEGADLSFYFGLGGVLTLALSVFGSVLATQSALYHARDNELLLSMPVSPLQVLLSRLLFLAILNGLFAAVVVLPCFAVYLLFSEVSFLAGLAFVFFFLVLALAGLAISCLLGWLLALVTARMKHKNIVSLFFGILFLCLYFAAMTALGRGAGESDINVRLLVDTLSPYLLPFSSIGGAILTGDLAVLYLFLLPAALLVGLAAFFLSRTYLRMLTTQHESARYVYREKTHRSNLPTVALIKKELRHFCSNATYMMNEGLGLLFAVGLSIYFFVERHTLLSMLEELELPGVAEMLPSLAAALLCLCSSMVVISAPSVSLEGKSIWLAQSLPVTGGQILCAKAYAHMVVATPFYLVASAFCVAASGAGVAEAVGLFLLPFSCNAFIAFLGVVWNVLFPKLDWINEAYAVKSGISVMLTMFGMMLLGGLLVIAAVVLSLLGVPGWLFMLGLTLLFGGLAVALHSYLLKRGAARFAAL